MARCVALQVVTGGLLLAGVSASVAAAAPPAPSGLTVLPAATTAATSVTASWTVPDGTPAGAVARWTLCADGGGCSTGSTTDARAVVPTPQEGRFVLAVRLEDEAQQPGDAATVPVVVDRTPPAGPAAVSYGAQVDWADPPGPQTAPIVRAHWRMCTGGDARVDQPGQCAEGSSTERPFATPRPALPLPPMACGGTYGGPSLALWLEDAAGNVAPSSAVRAPGLPVPTATPCGGSPVPPPPAVLPPPVGPPPAGRRATTLRMSVHATGPARARRLTVRAATGSRRATGRVAVAVTIPAARTGGRTRRVDRTLVLAGGRSTSLRLRLPARAARVTVRGRYGGDAAYLPASRTTRMAVPRR
jgi:hypothetical protein